ncbi:chaperone protein ClpB1-like isoform X2 [Lycium barbarum]|uniref:chaperone protein ClpB1-like isoform X2 n=1 Tax=Lycium barbarum TaxID=112863 RepID=UPI00293F5BA6|nr:chaperone protein ClpB1-like isoform X2 [Lycium barbarum]
MVDNLLARPKDWRELVSLEYFAYSHGVGDVVHERVNRARYTSEAMFSKMRSKLVEQVTPVQTVAKALFKCIDADHDHLKDKHCQQVASFLFTGLTSMGQRQLVDDLSKYLVADDGTTMLVEVDLATCTSPNSFLRNERGLLLKNTILMRPYSVIVVFNLQLAHQSAFTTIISILDDGLVSDNDGTVVDFRKTIIIFVLDQGNKGLISKLVGGGPYGSINQDRNMDKDPIGFRFEVLNRVDEIMLFNADLLHGARLSMKEGRHLVMTSPGINDALVNLFYNGKREVDGNNRNLFDELMRITEDACMSQLRRGLVKF